MDVRDWEIKQLEGSEIEHMSKLREFRKQLPVKFHTAQIHIQSCPMNALQDDIDK